MKIYMIVLLSGVEAETVFISADTYEDAKIKSNCFCKEVLKVQYLGKLENA